MYLESYMKNMEQNQNIQMMNGMRYYGRKDNGKCYGIIREMECRKLGIQADGIIDILEVRVNEANSRLMLQNYGYYKTRFENDKKWIGIMLGNPGNGWKYKKIIEKEL